MNRIYYATTNKGKVETLTRALKTHPIEIVPVAIDMPEPRSYDLAEIARAKVRYAHASIADDVCPTPEVIALDAGFFMNAWNGFPRSFGNFALETIGIEGILALNRARPGRAAFRHCLAYYNGRDEPVTFQNEVAGTLADPPQGTRENKPWLWSDLATIFMPDGANGKTLAEMAEQEFHAWKAANEDGKSYAAQFAAWYLNGLKK